MNSKPRIAIIGVGQVGGAAAYALILSGIAAELLLVDIDIDLRDGQIQDLSDVAYSKNSNTRVRAATYREAAQSDIVVITAGSKHLIGQTTIDYTARNISIVRNIVEAMRPFRSDTILLVVSNPVDLVTTIAGELSQLPPSQIMGSGTFLDSVRLRGMMADKAKVAPNSIDLFSLGVHGDAQVVAWSVATVGGVPLEKSLPPTTFNRVQLSEECRNRTKSIVRAKGATPFGVGSIVSSICSSILLDKCDVRPVSHYQPEHECCFSMPVVLGRKGVLTTIAVPLDGEEEARLAKSVEDLKRVVDWARQSFQS